MNVYDDFHLTEEGGILIFDVLKVENLKVLELIDPDTVV